MLHHCLCQTTNLKTKVLCVVTEFLFDSFYKQTNVLMNENKSIERFPSEITEYCLDHWLYLIILFVSYNYKYYDPPCPFNIKSQMARTNNFCCVYIWQNSWLHKLETIASKRTGLHFNILFFLSISTTTTLLN